MSEEKLLDFKTVVDRYHFKPWGLRHLIRNRAIPLVKISTDGGRGRIFFDPKELDRWIEERKIPVQNRVRSTKFD